MAKLYNLAGMGTATTGTGTITLGSAMYGHLTFAQAGVSDGDTVTYAIKDGAASEIGRGVYTSSGTTLTRTVLKSTNSNSAISLSGAAEVFITPAAEDIIPRLSSTTDNTVPRHDGADGLLQASGVTIDDSNNVTGVVGLTLAGVLSADDSTSTSAPVYTFDGDANTGISHPAADVVAISTGGSERLRVTASGNVGIGTTTNNLFDQAGAARPLIVQSASTTTTIGASTNALAIVNSDTTTDNTSTLAFGAITGANTNQYADAEIVAIHGARTNGQYPTGQLAFLTSTSVNSAPTEKLRITSAGNVGIGTTGPSAQLHTTGSVRFATFGAGTLVTDASGNVSASSDEELKDGIEPFTRGLSDILGIAPISYNWNALSGLDRMNRYHGFSAQNVEAAIPEAVGVGADGFLTLQDRPIIAALVNAVKELAGGVQFDYGGHTFVAGRPEKDRAALLITVAQTAIIQGVQAGNYRWFDADADFTIDDASGVHVQMDAVTAFAYCNALLRAIF